MVMRQPEYYSRFHCLAGGCPDDCCKEWTVAVDGKTLRTYRTLSGPLGEAVRHALREENGETVLFSQGEQCPFHREDGLCRIHGELGEAALCQVCREYPRLCHDYGTFRELGLELSCPEAARLILSDSGEVVAREVPGGEPPDYNEEDMALLFGARERALALLAEDGRTPGEALALLMMWGVHTQRGLDGEETPSFSPEDALADAKAAAEPGSVRRFRDFFLGLEILTRRWREKLETVRTGPLPEAALPLARYFVSRYWLQAVWDLDLYGRVKLAVISCLLISFLEGDIAENAQLYSKEIENDPDNVEALLDAAYSSPAFTDGKLLGMLLASPRLPG